LAERALGRRICSRPGEFPDPPWLAAEEELKAATWEGGRQDYASCIQPHHRTVVGRLRAWGILHSAFPRGCAALFDLYRDEAVEVRMPFYDRRLVEFSMSRPPEELNQPGEFKVLLQQAMVDKLPHRTREFGRGGRKPGTAISYINARYPGEARALLSQLSSRPLISAELGLVDERRFMGSLEAALAKDDVSPDVHLTSALLVEDWLQDNELAVGR
jgi:hypothetical protein